MSEKECDYPLGNSGAPLCNDKFESMRGTRKSRREPDVWLVTGASSGFGRAIAEVALEVGYRVVATARDVGALSDIVDRYSDRAQALSLDVTDPSSIARAIQEAGRIDVLVNNAGFGLLGAFEDLDDEELRSSFETNLFGALDMARSVLPGMRERRYGHIVQMSSVVGVTSGLGGSAYAGPKAALEAVSIAIAAEVAAWDIGVTIVEPGAFRTDFAGPSLKVARSSSVYEGIIGPPLVAFQAGHGNQPGDPKLGARAIISAVERDDPPLRLPLGSDAISWLKTYHEVRLGEVRSEAQVALNTDFE